MGTPLASAFAGGMMSGSIPQCSYAPSGAVRGTPAWISSKIRDRESGGWGKRVDFGGGRIIKKKKTTWKRVGKRMWRAHSYSISHRSVLLTSRILDNQMTRNRRVPLVLSLRYAVIGTCCSELPR